MMKKIIFFASAALAAFMTMSCNKQDTVAPKTAQLTVNLDGVTVGSMSTKATSALSTESDLYNVQLFVFNSDGSLDAYASGNTSSLIMKVTTGTKDIYAVANAPSLSSITTKSDLLNRVCSLAYALNPGYLTMVGNASTNVTGDMSLNIVVSRIASRISISKITNKMSSAQWQSQAFVITKIYVINAVVYNEYGLSPCHSDWFANKMQYDAPSFDDILYDNVSSGTVAYNSSYSDPHYFYVFPNTTDPASDVFGGEWSSRCTRLVVEATLGGTPYYYPITIPSISNNRTYTINELTITRPGSSSPDVPVSTASATFTISVADWVAATGTGTGDISI